VGRRLARVGIIGAETDAHGIEFDFPFLQQAQAGPNHVARRVGHGSHIMGKNTPVSRGDHSAEFVEDRVRAGRYGQSAT
jgi:hypothetical protein